MSLWGTLKAAIVGVGVGEASAEVFGPILTPAGQDAWAKNPYKALAVGAVAELVAQGLTGEGTAESEAALTGYNPQRLNALTQAVMKAPSIGEALTLLRRGEIQKPDFVRILRKQMMEPHWDEHILSLQQNYLEPAEIAKAIHRGIMQPEGLLIASPPSTPGHVKSIPPSPLPTLTEAAASGVDAERLRILVGNAGLPLGLHEMLGLYNRGYMTAADVQRGIAESNLRNEYQDVALQLARRLLTPTEYSELRLRGWITDQDARDGAAMSGMTGPDADQLYNMHGRPLAIHQVTTAIERNGAYDDPKKPDTPGSLRAALVQELQAEGVSLVNAHAYVDAVQESNIRPQFYRMALANRYTLPSYFVVKAMLSAGAITVEEATGIFLQEGWRPDLATKAAQALGGHTTGGKQLTTAQIRAAVASGQMTHAEALKRLEARGYAPADAEIILDNPGRTPSSG